MLATMPDIALKCYNSCNKKPPATRQTVGLQRWGDYLKSLLNHAKTAYHRLWQAGTFAWCWWCSRQRTLCILAVICYTISI